LALGNLDDELRLLSADKAAGRLVRTETRRGDEERRGDPFVRRSVHGLGGAGIVVGRRTAASEGYGERRRAARQGQRKKQGRTHVTALQDGSSEKEPPATSTFERADGQR